MYPFLEESWQDVFFDEMIQEKIGDTRLISFTSLDNYLVTKKQPA